ncbi:MAG: hypothetical protein BGO67_05735 [Alphaproteobacteria bacterium 41-28]|nr:MAG: hypothetical protein BGO67_05735 [Alphaproteobacteria bacterium 41-28]
MRILPFMPLQEGYEPSSPELNQEEGVLDISDDSDCNLIEESKIIAETLILRCVLRPIPLTDRTIHAQLISEGEILESTPLYEEESISYGYEREVENSKWQGMAFDYAGMGRGIHQGTQFVFYGEALPLGRLEVENPLYVKPFKIESQNVQERTTTLLSGEILTSPPGVLDTRVLQGYGGYYKEGVALNEIQQVYYALTPSHSQTRVRLFSSSHLQEQHTPPPYGGKGLSGNVTFSLLREEEILSLPGAIAAGYARLSVIMETHTILFRSYLCEPVPGHHTFVNVYFRPSTGTPHPSRALRMTTSPTRGEVI